MPNVALSKSGNASHSGGAPSVGEAKPAPVAAGSRIEDIDVIRGVALFGVLMMNLVEGFRIPFSFRHVLPTDASPLDRVVRHVLGVVLAGKAMTLFSLLFGVGLCIFFERASARGPGAMALLARRLVVLLAFGLAHLFFLWHGDVLTSYAASGLLVLPLIRLRPAILFALAVALLGGRAFIVWVWPNAVLPFSADEGARHYADALATYGGGSYFEVLVFRAKEIWDFVLRFSFVHMPTEMSNFLLGMCIWRTGVVRHVERYRRALVWAALIGIGTGAGFAIFRILPVNAPLIPNSQGQFFRVVDNAVLRMYALGYGALLLLLLRLPAARAVLLRLAPLGQMAFTNYLTETIFFSTLFYGYGFGLLTKVGFAEASVLGVVFYAVQGVASAMWLRRFRFGPFEWAWRSLTYGKLQPMRR